MPTAATANGDRIRTILSRFFQTLRNDGCCLRCLGAAWVLSPVLLGRCLDAAWVLLGAVSVLLGCRLNAA
eukprot:9024913-Lingulodinium_polyedra.AAC.1